MRLRQIDKDWLLILSLCIAVSWLASLLTLWLPGFAPTTGAMFLRRVFPSFSMPVIVGLYFSGISFLGCVIGRLIWRHDHIF